MFFFFSTKTITTGEGGMLTTNKKLFELALSLREGKDWTKKIWNYINMIGEHVECLNSVHYWELINFLKSMPLMLRKQNCKNL